MEKGDSIRVGGDMWTIVDISPAHELGEMIAVILEEEGIIAKVTALNSINDSEAIMGTLSSIGTTYVIVPEESAQAALDIIAQTVTDYEGEELDKVLEEMALAEADYTDEDDYDK